jgi:ribosomal protein S17
VHDRDDSDIHECRPISKKSLKIPKM